MKTHTMLALVTAATFSFAAHAHDCSGGGAGGMDATGNQCNGETIVASEAMFAPSGASMRAAAPADGAGTSAVTTVKHASRHNVASRQLSSRKHRAVTG